MRWGIALSIALLGHALIFFWPGRASRPEAIEITSLAEVLPPVRSLRHGRRGSGSGGSARAMGKASRLGMRDLLPATRPAGEGVPLGGDGSGDGSGTTDAVGLTEYLPLTPFFEALWAKIDRGIDYPEALAENWIEGSVSLRLAVDGSGRMRDGFLRVNADHDLLKLYVLAALWDVLHTPLPERVRAKRDRLILQLQFDFSTYAHPKLARREPGGYFRNVLRFRKETFAPGRGDRSVARYYRKFPLPLKPTPLGIQIDFVKAYDMLFSKDELDPDALRQHRLEMFRERLQIALRKHEGGGRER